MPQYFCEVKTDSSYMASTAGYVVSNSSNRNVGLFPAAKPFSVSKPYRDFADFLVEHFQGKVQKISVNAGFTCPTRDGTLGTGGCTYCNNQSFNPQYCSAASSITEQLIKGKAFFSRKYPTMKYLAYFQAYTNTYASMERLRAMYEEALAVPGVAGLIIGTRPDCMPDELLHYLAGLSRHTFVLVEYGAETACDTTLRLINRGHLWAHTVDAVTRTHAHGILCGLHLILGLPNETYDDFRNTIAAVAQLPIDTLKLHQLQLIRGTRLARQVAAGEVSVTEWTAHEYVDVCIDLLRRLPRRIAVERFVSQSPAELLITPRWGLKNHEFTHLLHHRLAALRATQADLL